MLSFRPDALPRTVSNPTGQRPAWVVSMACLCTPMASQALDVAVAEPVSRIEMRSEIVPGTGSAAAGGSNSRSSVPQAAMLSGAVRNTAWVRQGNAAVGVGVEAPMGTVGNSLSSGAGGSRADAVTPNLLVGVAVQATPRSRLVVDTPVNYRNTANSLNPNEGGREVRVGLVIKPADPLKNLRAGQLFKLELSGRSQLAVKPRSGGVAVSYSSKF